MEMLRSSNLQDHDDVECPSHLQLETPPVFASHLYSLPRRRAETAESVVRRPPPDPALLRYLKAIDEFEDRIAVTPERLNEYVESVLADGREIGSEAFPVNDVGELLVFERLHEIALGPLAGTYEIAFGEGLLNNGWVERRPFILRRREAPGG